MHIHQQPAPKAAYYLHTRGQPVQGFVTLRELHGALRALPAAIDYYQNHYTYNRDGNLQLDVRVYEAAGRRREDLEDLNHNIYYGWPWIDHAWDGDIRPRGVPVEGTGKRTWGNYYRYPKTQRDRRLNCPPLEEGEPPVRGKRRPHIIPTCWEDIPRRNYKNRNWKQFRLTRWR